MVEVQPNGQTGTNALTKPSLLVTFDSPFGRGFKEYEQGCGRRRDDLWCGTTEASKNRGSTVSTNLPQRNGATELCASEFGQRLPLISEPPMFRRTPIATGADSPAFHLAPHPPRKPGFKLVPQYLCPWLLAAPSFENAGLVASIVAVQKFGESFILTDSRARKSSKLRSTTQTCFFLPPTRRVRFKNGN
ncbi:hypothetical protein EJ08DRAFT_664028 [Tothia fuscella]|uniref:Uncharacterized protein n=1 Tax=Tothia fuscella TaxID=1048955 RepID=A0A9P4NJP4_9PEZI|nr:hypothetical protein EJ08DRAFT_664028 [Tothia fuscella]